MPFVKSSFFAFCLLTTYFWGSLEATSPPRTKKTIQKLDCKKQKLDRHALIKAATFIETSLPAYVAANTYYIPRKVSGLKYAIENDPVTHLSYIILKGSKNLLGKGTRKVVHKAILYNHKRPQVVARAVEQTANQKELTVTKLVAGKQGLCKSLGFTSRQTKTRASVAFYSKLYKRGSLHDALKNGLKMSFEDTLAAAQSLASGLKALHKKGLVHRDLGTKNYLVNKRTVSYGKRRYDLVIADLGRTDFAQLVAGSKPQGNVTYLPPEALDYAKLSPNDYFAIDIYALGCTLYRLFHGKKAPWLDARYVKDTTKSLASKTRKLTLGLNKATKYRRKQLQKKRQHHHLTAKQSLELAILEMLHVDPKLRPTASELRQTFDSIEP